MDRDKLIQKYLHSDLTETEHQAFLELYENDLDFSEEVNIQSVFYAARSKEFKDNLKSKLKDTPVHDVNSRKQSRQLFLILRNVAAILLLGFVSFYLFNSIGTSDTSNTFQDLVETHIKTTHSPPYITMDDDMALDKTWTIAIEAYRTKKYDVVIDQLSQIENPTKEQTLYLALSNMYVTSPNINQSIVLLEDLLSTDNDFLNDEVEWFLSLAHFKNGDINSGKTILQKITAAKSWNHKKASRLLQSLHEAK